MREPVKWTKENLDYLKKNYPRGVSSKKMAAHLGCSEDTVRNKAARIGLHRPKFWTKERDEVMRELYSHTLNVDLAKKLGTTESAVSARGFVLGLKKTKEFIQSHARAGQFPKGNIPMNKGRKMREWASEEAIQKMRTGWYKKGNIPLNHKEIGHERVTRDGFIIVKVAEPDVFVHKHRVIWEQHNGKIPEGMIVTFKDGNKRNFDISNLQLMTRSENMMRNSYLRYPQEYQIALRAIGRLNRKINAIEKGKKW